MGIRTGHGGDPGEPSGGPDRVSALAAGLAERGDDVTPVAPTPSRSVPYRLDPAECVYVDGGVLDVHDLGYSRFDDVVDPTATLPKRTARDSDSALPHGVITTGRSTYHEL